MYYAEKQILKALPMMAKKATPTIFAGPLSTISRRLKARSCASSGCSRCAA
jgi:hypothetical protein